MFLKLAHTKTDVFRQSQKLALECEIDAAIGIAYKLQYCDIKSLEALANLIISCFKQLTAMIGRSVQES